METLNYVPFTANEVALTLEYSDCDEMTGEYIARAMLSGVEEFTDDELDELAAYKGVTIEYLTEHDPAFQRYSDPGTVLRISIAAKALKLGVNAEVAAEICGLSLDKVQALK